VTRGDEIQRVREERTAEIRIDECNGGADSAEAQPDRHVIRTIRHDETYGVAPGKPAREPPARVAVTCGGELAIAELRIDGNQRRRVAEALAEAADQSRQGERAVPLDRRRTLQGAHPALER
jgi:hypothetical protein